jgi:hypothetical protein
VVVSNHHSIAIQGVKMTHKENEIYAILLQLCEEILPKTSMQNNAKIRHVLILIKDHLNG